MNAVGTGTVLDNNVNNIYLRLAGVDSITLHISEQQTLFAV